MEKFNKVVKWAEDRNLVGGSTPAAQMLKLFEEAGETAGAIAKNRKEAIKDGIGDQLVVLTILAAQCGYTIEECLDAAWLEIKDRKGKMINGIFVKQSDL